jgi:16S rRNA (guanine527-N7)-methyltransferase
MMKKFAFDYLELLKGEFGGINLTRIETPDDFYNKQILDSILPLEKSELFSSELKKAGTLLDIGFGGGFPVLPLARSLPLIKFVGFDARAKKVDVVTEIAQRLGIENVHLIHMRFEEVVFDIPLIITFKAVGKISEILPLIKSTNKILVCFYKGPNVRELESLKSIEKDWDLKEEISYEVEGTEGRTFLCFRNKNVLRGTINSKLIKFSELL